MRTTPTRLLSAATIAILGCSLAFAQQAPNNQPEPDGQSANTDQHAGFHAYRATDFLGSRVVNPEGDRLGTYRDLVFDMQDGQILYAIISAGGFLGIGSDWNPVPPEVLQIRSVDEGVEFVIDMDEEKWKRAPSIDRKKINDLAIEVRSREIHQFYGAEWTGRPAEFGARSGTSSADQLVISSGQQQEEQTEATGQNPEQPAQTAENTQPQTTPQTDKTNSETVRRTASRIEQAMIRAGIDQENARPEAERLAREISADSSIRQQEIAQKLEQAMTDAGIDQTTAEDQARQVSNRIAQNLRSGETRLFLANDLRNTPIINNRFEEIGEITDFIVNPQQGRLALILFAEETGILQSVDQEYAAAPNAFADMADDQVQLNITRDALREAPLFSADRFGAQVRELAGIDRETAQQNPQIFRYSDHQTSTPGVFGSPDREKNQSPRERTRESDVRQLEKYDRMHNRN